MKAKFNIEYLLWLALALALAGSLKHLASVFASVDGNTFMGWVQAVAIDTGLFSLAYKIKVRRATRQGVKLLTGAVALFTVISVYGNLAYGLAALGSLPQLIQATKPYVLAATLPVLVLILSHLLSDDRAHANELAQREAKRAARVTGSRANDTSQRPDEQTPEERRVNLARANERRQVSKEERQARLLALQGEGLSQSEMAGELQVSLSTIKRYVRELNGRGVSHGDHDN